MGRVCFDALVIVILEELENGGKNWDTASGVGGTRASNNASGAFFDRCCGYRGVEFNRRYEGKAGKCSRNEPWCAVGNEPRVDSQRRYVIVEFMWLGRSYRGRSQRFAGSRRQRPTFVFWEGRLRILNKVEYS